MPEAIMFAFDNREGLCSCGYLGSYTRRWGHFRQCPRCKTGNVRVLHKSKMKSAVAGTQLELIDKHDKGFHVIKRRYLAHFNPEMTSFELKSGLSQEMIFDWRQNRLEYNKIKEDGTKDKIAGVTFFREVDQVNLMNLVSTDKSRELYKLVNSKLGCYNYERSHLFWRALQRFTNDDGYRKVEIFYSLGFKNLNFAFEHQIRHSDKVTPHEILGVPKFMIKHLKEMDYINTWSLSKLGTLEKEFDGNSVKIMCDIFFEESSLSQLLDCADYIIQLKREYGYNDAKKLCLYLAREVKLQQGIELARDAASLLRDLARMSKDMDLDFEKYSKSLKKDHDIASMNYRMMKDEIKKKNFVKVVDNEEYKMLEYKRKDYSIVAPHEPEDLVAEGDSLSHCVASYVNDVINGKCKIVFLRETANVDQSLVTVEVRDNHVRQIRGRQNREPRHEEMEFVRKWAEKKELQVNVYSHI